MVIFGVGALNLTKAGLLALLKQQSEEFRVYLVNEFSIMMMRSRPATSVAQRSYNTKKGTREFFDN